MSNAANSIPVASTAPSVPAEPERFQPVAGVLAFLFPGAGHLYLGDPVRGVLIGAGVLSLFGFGLLIAGISAVDSQLFYINQAKTLVGKVTGHAPTLDSSPDGDPIWFTGSLLVGPVAIAVDAYHQYELKVIEPFQRGPRGGVIRRTPKPDEGRDPTNGQPTVLAPGQSPPYSKALGRVGEIGTLSCALAGMMNLIAIIDASFSHRRRRSGAAGGRFA